MKCSLNLKRASTLAAVLLVGSLASGGECTPPPRLQAALHAHPTAENYAATGEYFGEKEQHRCAADAWAAALKLEPRSAKFSYLLGLNLYAAGQSEQAAEALQQSAELNPGSLQTRLLLATVLDQLHRGDQAATEWRAALDLDPNSNLALDGVARSLLAKNENSAVIQMLGSRPLDENLALDLAIAYDHSRRIDEATATLVHAHNADPSSTKLANALALVYLKQERRQDAAALMEKQYALHPNDLETQVDYFRVLVINEEREKASALGKTLLARLPHDFDVLYLNGELEREAGDYAGAKKHLEEAVQLNPSHANCRYNLGVALARLGEPAEAKDQLEKAISLGWTGPEIHYELANVYRALADPDMAQQQMKLYQQETRAREERTLAISKAAQADQDMLSGNLAAAESQYRLAVEANPNLTPAWIGLAATLAKQSRLPEAKEALGHALQLEPENPRALALARDLDGNPKNAPDANAPRARNQP